MLVRWRVRSRWVWDVVCEQIKGCCHKAYLARSFVARLGEDYKVRRRHHRERLPQWRHRLLRDAFLKFECRGWMPKKISGKRKLRECAHACVASAPIVLRSLALGGRRYPVDIYCTKGASSRKKKSAAQHKYQLVPNYPDVEDLGRGKQTTSQQAEVYSASASAP